MGKRLLNNQCPMCEKGKIIADAWKELALHLYNATLMSWDEFEAFEAKTEEIQDKISELTEAIQ